MKRLFQTLLVGLGLLVAAGAQAQNVQVLYDTDRGCVTSTVEMFRPDAYGSTYFFVDIDASPKVSGAYWEISRELNFWQDTELSWLSAHLEYNGGLNTAAGSFNNCWLAGATYSGHSKDFSKTWSLSAMYKVIPGTIGLTGNKEAHSFQITGVWGIDFAKGWCTFSGFFDFWREPRIWQNTNFIFISEPQFWVNLNKIDGWENIGLSVGGELELSANFVSKGFHALPAIGAKWTF
ncbi:MAG: DUF5020 family protein [Bacteroidales bacterium]|nr:DUF5020 family protein [Bacteroidales bacterium]